MARIFTTKFEFNKKVYDAIITIIPKDGEASFNIKVIDLNLGELLPDGEIKYQGTEGFKKLPLMNDRLGESLMHCIHSAIEKHLVTL
ncbi:MAG: hypothetical protein ACM3VS_09410 [Candidatus Dadabacteria bacterium]